MSSVLCCLIGLLFLAEGAPALYAGEKDVLDNALHWETLAAPKKFRNHLFSSYDRTGGNSDCGNFYGVDEHGWSIMADLEGAGCMVRFWATYLTASNDWRIRIYVDNLDEPTVEAPFLDFFGHFPPFVPPLADSTSGAWCCYLPILFREHLRITRGPANPPIYGYYQVSVLEFDDNVGVTSFTMPPSPWYQQKLDSLSSLLSTIGRPPWTPADSIRHDTTVTLAPASSVEAASISGGGTIFRFEVESPPMSWQLARALVLSISYDGEALPRIETPLGDLIAIVFSAPDINALGFSLRNNRIGFYFPMPFKRGARLVLTNTSTSSVPIQTTVCWTPTEIHSTRLCALSQVESDLVYGEPVTLMDVAGTGHLVACMLTIEAEYVKALQEGDELVWIDSDIEPSWHGTGTEDYFSCGYHYMGGLLSRAYFGVNYFRNPGGAGAYRIHALDYIAFTNHLNVSIEHGPYSTTAPGTYRSVLLYYAQLGKWSFEDADGDGQLYPGEPFHIQGRLLAPDSPVEVTLGEVLLEDLTDTTTPLGIYEGSALCPSMPDGNFLLAAFCGGDIDTILADLRVESELSLSIVNLRGDPILFPFDTLELSAFPVSSLSGAAAYCSNLPTDWLPGTLCLDSLFVLRGRVQVPALPDGPIQVRLHTGVGDVQDTRVLSRQIRAEIERFYPPFAWFPDRQLYWNLALGESLGVELLATTVGDSMVFAVPFGVPGQFDIALFVQKGPNRGIMNVLWDDTIRVSGYDCYGSTLARSDSIDLGTMSHDGGTHRITFRVVGKNQSSSGYRLVADQIVFTGLSHYQPTEPDVLPRCLAESFFNPCYPNPFNSVTTLRYGVSRPGHVRLIVYNVLGQRVATLVDSHQEAGIHEVKLNTSELPSGLYFCQLQAKQFQKTEKLLLLK
jgi:hypothetical protein